MIDFKHITQKDRRRSTRIDVVGTEAKCSGNGVGGVYAVSNLSFDGALLVGSPLPKVGSRIDICLAKNETSSIAVSARAVRHGTSILGQRTFGVSFDNLSQETQKLISGTLRNQTTQVPIPKVLVAASYGWPAKQLVKDLRMSDRQELVATTYKDALDILIQEYRDISVLFVESFRAEFTGLANTVANWFPDIKRVMIAGPILPRRYARYLSSGLMDAALIAPWTLESVREAVRLPATIASPTIRGETKQLGSTSANSDEC